MRSRWAGRRSAVLALLLLEPGRVVPAGRLMEEVWRSSPPQGAATPLRSYNSRLCAVLDPEAALEDRGGGYMITIGADDIDAGRFERLVAAGHAALREGEAAAAGNRFRDALALCHGRALADVCDVETLALESARLEELRLTAMEGRIEADIELGRHAQVIGELERLVAEYPVRERLWRLLVLALYRGVWMAELAGISEPDLVSTQVMEALGVRQESDIRCWRRCGTGCVQRSCCWRPGDRDPLSCWPSNASKISLVIAKLPWLICHRLR